MFHHIEFDKAYSGPNPPAKEPERQYYFIGKCRKLLEKEQERLGRPLTFHVTTFGCQMNARDSEKLAGILEQIGIHQKCRNRSESYRRRARIHQKPSDHANSGISKVRNKIK